MKNRDWQELLSTLGHDPSLVLSQTLATGAQTNVATSAINSFAFVGEDLESGDGLELLQKMIAAMGLSSTSAHVLGLNDLQNQIESLRPSWIIALGSMASEALLENDQKITLLRSRIHTDHKWFRDEQKQVPIKITVTFHPIYLLRNPDMKKACWDDLQMVMRDALLTPKTTAN